MSSSNSKQLPTPKSVSSPDYQELVKFLLVPFVDSPDSLKVDCERSNGNAKVWVRLAFDSTDKGRVLGRGGRNLNAVRSTLAALARVAGESIFLDIFGGIGSSQDLESAPAPRRVTKLPSPRPRPKSDSRDSG
ncbi:MAG: KH domain-containing protein [Geitlerinemataceae cyanobacterium]